MDNTYRQCQHLTLLENIWIRSLPRNFTIWTFVPRNSQKCVSGAYDIQNVLVLVSRGLRLIAVNMHYAKFTPWTPKLRQLFKLSKFAHNPHWPCISTRWLVNMKTVGSHLKWKDKFTCISENNYTVWWHYALFAKILRLTKKSLAFFGKFFSRFLCGLILHYRPLS